MEVRRFADPHAVVGDPGGHVRRVDLHVAHARPPARSRRACAGTRPPGCAATGARRRGRRGPRLLRATLPSAASTRSVMRCAARIGWSATRRSDPVVTTDRSAAGRAAEPPGADPPPLADPAAWPTTPEESLALRSAADPLPPPEDAEEPPLAVQPVRAATVSRAATAADAVLVRIPGSVRRSPGPLRRLRGSGDPAGSGGIPGSTKPPAVSRDRGRSGSPCPPR